MESVLWQEVLYLFILNIIARNHKFTLCRLEIFIYLFSLEYAKAMAKWLIQNLMFVSLKLFLLSNCTNLHRAIKTAAVCLTNMFE